MATTTARRGRGSPAPTPQPRRRTEGVRRRLTKLFSPFWVVPALCCLVAFAMGLALPALDQQLADRVPFLFPAGSDGARTMLSTIAGAMISITGLVFSITIVVLQLASSQFSPRVLHTFLDERVPQFTLGVFAASFVYALTVMRTVSDAAPGPRGGVPQIAVTVSFLLVLASVAMFLAFIHHITQAISVEVILQEVGTEARDLLRESRAERPQDAGSFAGGEPDTADDDRTPSRTLVLVAEQSGYLDYLDAPALVHAAVAMDARIEMLRPLGTFLVPDQPVALVHPLGKAAPDKRRCHDAVFASASLTSRRSMEQDVTFGIRQLVDIGERALSPGVNDPTTAVQVVNELHTILHCLAVEPDLPASHRDDDGTTRLVLCEWTFEAYLDLCVDEICHYGKDSLQVPARLEEMLTSLEQAAQPEHRASIQHKRGQVARASLRE
jgi:uncharacterized membrane protein